MLVSIEKVQLMMKLCPKIQNTTDRLTYWITY